jgi:mono/diheme cytochrome c family protein
MLVRTMAMLAMLSVGTGSTVAAEAIDFTKQIEPIFTAHCVKCHGAAKAQGKLRLDGIAGIEEKLKAKPTLLVAGKPDESLLYQRLVLPADNPKRMPKGADPLKQDEIDLVAEWIKQGAALKATVATAATEAAKPTENDAAKEKPALPEVAPAPQEAIDNLIEAGARVTPLFAGSNLLEISFAGRSEPAGDAEVALLSAVAEQVHSLNLADAKLSSAGLAPLSAMPHLAWLHLERATIDDAALAHLSELQQLEYLNLYGTPIGDAGLKHLSKLPRLVKLYLWQTKVSYDAATSLEQATPGLVANLGYDHPVVAQKRLIKEREQAQKRLDDVKSQVAELEKQLAQSKDAVEAGTKQLEAIEKELKAVAPASEP